MEEFIQEKEGKAKKINRFPYIFWSLVIISLALFFFVFAVSFQQNKNPLTCGDGTFYSKCSLNKPYYCDSGELVRNATLCGCPDVMEKVDGDCVFADYNGEGRELMLDYVVNGEEGHVGLYLHPEISAYLNTLPRSLVYDEGEVPRRDDFKLMKINNEIQREALIPLVVAIQNKAPNSVEEQARIAISVVQNIAYSEPETQKVLGMNLRLARYPYQVLNESSGSCEGKSELMAFLLREIGYGVSLFYYQSENHEAVGIKCPVKYSLNNTGYCFVESTVPAPISYSTGSYLGIAGGRLHSSPDVVILNKGISLGDNLYEYKDAKKLSRVLDKNGKTGTLNILQRKILDKLRIKYALTY